jgi:hypothetical protein
VTDREEEEAVARVCLFAGHMPHLDERFPTPKSLGVDALELAEAAERKREIEWRRR